MSKIDSSNGSSTADCETRWLIAELDSGSAPPGVLVVRETKWQRAVAAALGFLIGIPASYAVTIVAVRFGDIASALLFSVFAVVPLGGAVWLLNELLCATCYYVALDDRHFYRRRGPRRLVVLRLEDLDGFDFRLGTLFVYQRPNRKRITVIKNAYAPEDVSALARRMQAWCQSPRGVCVKSASAIDFLEVQRIRAVGNRQIAWALRVLCVYPLLIVLSMQLRLLNAGPLAIALWFILVGVGLASLIAGVARRIAGTSKERPLRGHVSK